MPKLNLPTYREATSDRVAGIAARGFKSPWLLSADEIRSVCGSALTQRETLDDPVVVTKKKSVTVKEKTMARKKSAPKKAAPKKKAVPKKKAAPKKKVAAKKPAPKRVRKPKPKPVVDLTPGEIKSADTTHVG